MKIVVFKAKQSFENDCLWQLRSVFWAEVLDTVLSSAVRLVSWSDNAGEGTRTRR